MTGDTIMNRRRGITLLEVLVAIFVMAIGMLALLVLFPLGALSMAQALKDNRCQQAAANATSVALIRDLRNDAFVTSAMIKPDTLDPTKDLTSGYDGPSYPVLVDPVGALSTSYLDGSNKRFPRTKVNNIDTAAKVVRWFSLHDDVEFDGGFPVSSSSYLSRKNRFTWGYVLRRPRAFDPSAVELTVIVYSGRSLLTPTLEPTVQAAVQANKNDTSVTVSYTGTKPDIRSGTWIADVSMETVSSEIYQNGPVRSYFYRVVNVVESGSQLTLELQTPLKAQIPPAVTTGTPPLPGGTIAVMSDVAEVFEKGTGWMP